ncbi:conserved hypothetical protein [Ricinus communis]|uniref:Uncharacterized protein n=1 Tax=Ricinus communis TaxID=3988 RepID=B9R7B5_RICCO|nr:conserved hypothetical protein [Ricinus communis]
MPLHTDNDKNLGKDLNPKIHGFTPAADPTIYTAGKLRTILQVSNLTYHPEFSKRTFL